MWSGSLHYRDTAGDQRDRALCVPGAHARGGGDVACPAQAQHPDHRVAYGRHHLGSRAATHLAAVFIEDHIPHPMEPVLNPPVASHQPQQLAWGRLLRGEAGDEIGSLLADLAVAFAPVAKLAHLPEVGPVSPRIQFG